MIGAVEGSMRTLSLNIEGSRKRNGPAKEPEIGEPHGERQRFGVERS